MVRATIQQTVLDCLSKNFFEYLVCLAAYNQENDPVFFSGGVEKILFEMKINCAQATRNGSSGETDQNDHLRLKIESFTSMPFRNCTI